MTARRRRVRRHEGPKRRDGREVVVAVAASAAVVAVTVLALWLLRPGGLVRRQYRAGWLGALAIVALAIGLWYVLRPGSRWHGRGPWPVLAVIGAVGIATAAAGVLWPGGLVLDQESGDPTTDIPPDLLTPSVPDLAPTTVPSSDAGPTTSSPTAAPVTTAAGDAHGG